MSDFIFPILFESLEKIIEPAIPTNWIIRMLMINEVVFAFFACFSIAPNRSRSLQTKQQLP